MTGVDAILASPSPAVDECQAVELAREAFAVQADRARDLGSERDRTFRLQATDGRPVAVLKVSNANEASAVLDMEARAALHVDSVDPGLCVALPWRDDGSGPAQPGDDLARLRARFTDEHGTHWMRLYDVLPGASRIDAAALPDRALTEWGATTARLALALRGFTDPSAERVLPWDVQHALATRSMLTDIADPDAQAAVSRVLDAFEERVLPAWPTLRAQVLHTDLTVDNTLTDPCGLITGIVDFGDMSRTTLIADLASVLDSLAMGRDERDLLRMARLALDGYGRHLPLEDVELEVLGVAWAARSAVTIAIGSWRAAQGLEDAAFAERFTPLCLRVIHALEAIGWDEVAHGLGAPAPAHADPTLTTRRASAFGPATDPLFYDQPVQAVAAEGVWITEAGGRRLLDAYNNVPCVGHGHPRVTGAIARQARLLNTHTRYLHPAAIELAERLTATMPSELDTVLLVNSGSEANDLAWRMASALTGRTGGLCTSFAYHGITEATAALSPEGWLDGRAAEHVETWEPPDAYRGHDGTTASFVAAMERLRARGHEPAAAILDGVLTSDGIADLPAEHVRGLVDEARAAGALWIADEVQAGHGRTGEAMWSFQRAGVVPDFVTLGKPMGNGHPVAAVVTRSEIADGLVGRTSLFSTFGGNPVSAAAALAVLDVLEDERVLDRVVRTGIMLRSALTDIARQDSGVGDVRGVGLVCGVELVADPSTRAPDGHRTGEVREGMRQAGVLVGTTGRHANVLKIRPPLAFDEEHVPLVARALRTALDASTSFP